MPTMKKYEEKWAGSWWILVTLRKDDQAKNIDIDPIALYVFRLYWIRAFLSRYLLFVNA